MACQWGLTDVIKAPEAWDIITGGNNAIVAVVDTGVDYLHEDLAANMWVNTAESREIALMTMPNFVDDYYGINTSVTPSTGDPMDTLRPRHRHGGDHRRRRQQRQRHSGDQLANQDHGPQVLLIQAAPWTTPSPASIMPWRRGDQADGNATLVMILGWKQATNTYYNALHDALTHCPGCRGAGGGRRRQRRRG